MISVNDIKTTTNSEPSNNDTINISAIVGNETSKLDPVDWDEMPTASFYSVASRAQMQRRLIHSIKNLLHLR